MADTFAEFAMPDTALTRKAYDLAFATQARPLAHHSVRSYLFARAIAETRGAAGGVDDELLFLACLLHDMGLTEQGDGDQRFEVDGADVAAGFLRANGVAEDRVRPVWEAIALHTSVGIAERMGPVTALAQAGIGTDVVGRWARELPEGFAERVHAALPRLGAGRGLADAIVAQVRRDPAKAPLGTLPFELARQADPGFPAPDWSEVTAHVWEGVA